MASKRKRICRVCGAVTTKRKCPDCGAVAPRALRNIVVDELSFVDFAAIGADFEPLNKRADSNAEMDLIFLALDKIEANNKARQSYIDRRLRELESRLP